MIQRLPHYDEHGDIRAWTAREGDELVTRDLDDQVIETRPVPVRLTPEQTAAAVALALDAIDRRGDITADAAALADVLDTATAAGAAHLPPPPPPEEES